MQRPFPYGENERKWSLAGCALDMLLLFLSFFPSAVYLFLFKSPKHGGRKSKAFIWFRYMFTLHKRGCVHCSRWDTCPLMVGAWVETPALVAKLFHSHYLLSPLHRAAPRVPPLWEKLALVWRQLLPRRHRLGSTRFVWEDVTVPFFYTMRVVFLRSPCG